MFGLHSNLSFLVSSLMTMAATTGVVAGQITLQQVMEHGSEDDCWSAVYGIVYDLTAFAPEHTFGKPKQVYRMCGQDGTSQYDAAHGKHPEYLDMFPSIQILGDLVEEEEYIMTDKPTEPPTDPLTETAQAAEEASLLELANATMVNATNATIHFTLPGVFGNTTQDVISIGELQSHDTTDDCWVVYYGLVYNVTGYAKEHPGGDNIILNNCGEDGTEDYAVWHKEALLVLLQDEIMGAYDGPKA